MLALEVGLKNWSRLLNRGKLRRSATIPMKASSAHALWVREQTAPVAGHYEQFGKVKRVKGEGTTCDIFGAISLTLKQSRSLKPQLVLPDKIFLCIVSDAQGFLFPPFPDCKRLNSCCVKVKTAGVHEIPCIFMLPGLLLLPVLKQPANSPMLKGVPPRYLLYRQGYRTIRRRHCGVELKFYFKPASYNIITTSNCWAAPLIIVRALRMGSSWIVQIPQPVGLFPHRWQQGWISLKPWDARNDELLYVQADSTMINIPVVNNMALYKSASFTVQVKANRCYQFYKLLTIG